MTTDLERMIGDEFGPPKKEKPKKDVDNVVQLLVKFANENITKLVVSDTDSSLVYCVIKTNNHSEARNILSYKALMWLKDAYDLENDDIFSDESYKSALSRIAARAMHDSSSRETIYNRIAMIGDSIYYDLTKKKKEAENINLEISKKNKIIEKIKKIIEKNIENIENFQLKINSINSTIKKSTGLEQEKINQEIADLRAELAGLSVKIENYEGKISEISKQKSEFKKLINENENSVKELQGEP